MKKFLIILGVVAAIGLTACQGLEKLFAVTDEKIANVATSSPLEKRYTAFGNYEGEVVRYPSDDKLLKTITVYYPKAQNQAFPLVVMANGTGMAVSKYEPVLKHLASWGFVGHWERRRQFVEWQRRERNLEFRLEIKRGLE